MYAQLGHTLAAIKSRIVFQKRDISATPMVSFLKHIKASSIKGQSNIEEAAIGFYLSNHGFHLLEAQNIAGGSLTTEHASLAERHVAYTSEMSLRMFHYLITISAEEARFGQARNEGLFDFVESTTSADGAKWLKKVMGGELRGAGLLGDASSVGAASLGDCIKALEMAFRFAQWSHGFGGLPWAQIAETAGEVVRGTNSLELMIDKAFTLCHNNGAIFNKGHQFTTYRGDFYSILDIQASGQIPAAVHSKIKVGGFGSKSVQELHQLYARSFPEVFHAAYDPSLVKSMEKVRAAKAAAAQAKANAFISAGGGWGGGAVAQPSGPPKRPCDDIFTLDDLDSLSGSKGALGF
jgi:hypothetical protein